MEEFSGNELWNQCYERVCEIVKEFDNDPNFCDYAFFVHNVPREESEKPKDKTKSNVFSKLEKLKKTKPYCNAICSIRYVFGFTGGPFNKGEKAYIEIRRKGK
jgi:hypothetical protein